MNFHTKSTRIFLAILAILIIILLLYPLEDGYILYILRGLILFGVVWVVVLFRNLRKEFYNHKKTYPEQSTNTIGQEIHQIQVELKDHYEGLLHSVCNAIRSINPDYVGAIYMIDPSSSGYTLQRGTSDIYKNFIPQDHEVIGTILKKEDVTVFQQKEVREGWNNLFSEQTWRGSECLLGIRILYKSAPVGCILLQIDHFSKIQDRDRDILANLGEFVSLEMIKIEKIEELLTDNYYYARIANLFDSIDIFSTDDILFESIQMLCSSFFTYDKLTISMLDSSSETAVVKLVDGIKDDMDVSETFQLASTLHGRAIRKSQTLRSRYWHQDYPEKTRFKEGDEVKFNFSSVLIVPFRIKEISKGCISLERLTSRPFTDSDQRLLELLGITVGNILAWQKEYWKMHQSAIHDGLTGLLNHRAFMDRFEEEVSRAIRFQQNLVLVVLDLDKFKRINDTYGHFYGDYVIKTVGEIIKNSVRNIDVVARYGGEEYVVILVDTDKSTSLPVAQRIVSNIAEFQFNQDDNNVRMTISAGMAEFPKDADLVKGLIEKADAAMYEAKALGGNIVTFSP